MREHYVEIGTRKRLLRYTRQERIDIEQRFDCDLKTFVYEKAFPIVDGKPTLGGRLECQEALIFYGVRHIGTPKVSEDAISKELQEFVSKGGSIYQPLAQAIVGLLASGIMGWHPPLEEEEEKEGKEDGPAQMVIAPIKK